MIEFRKSNIFESDCEAWVNATNSVGVMGKGLALIFKQKFPDMYKDYAKICRGKKLNPGGIHIWENFKNNPKYIINFATKNHWRNPSQLEWVIIGLNNLRLSILDKKIKSIAVPSLGCGLGGLDYKDVKNVIEQWSKTLPNDVKIILYEPLN